MDIERTYGEQIVHDELILDAQKAGYAAYFTGGRMPEYHPMSDEMAQAWQEGNDAASEKHYK